MTRTDILNYLAKKNNAQTYLEIGVRIAKHNFDKINIKNKIGVDPGVEGVAEATHIMTSDVFFEKNNEFFDIIFIDGLHEATQVERDINNSLKFLTPNGYIVCHDLNPLIEGHQLPLDDTRRKLFVKEQKEKGNPSYGAWNGDCWKAWVKFRTTAKDLEMFVVDTDYGCGVLKRGHQKTINTTEQDMNFLNFEKNKKEWLNLISVNEFLNISL